MRQKSISKKCFNDKIHFDIMKTRKKTYEISVDVTMVKYIYIDAESEEQAREIVEKTFKENPYTYANNFSHYLNHEITDIEEV